MQVKEKFYINLVLTIILIILIVSYIDLRRLKQRVKNINRSIGSEKSIDRALLKNKLQNNNNVVDVLGVKFYVPYYPVDIIQLILVEAGEFFEQNDILAESDKYLNKNSIVLDIGANIGNHTLYWNKISKVKKVYAFEPVDDTYKILQKNIELNEVIPNSISINHIWLGDRIGKASVNGVYNLQNIGGTSIKMDDNGNFNVTTLDTFIEENFTENKIDLIKIDVEGFEYQVLVGAKDTLTKYNPIIIIESFNDKFEKVNSLLNKYGYEKVKDLPNFNYVYVKIGK